MDGHGTSPLGRCEGIPDPSEVSSLGKLSVFSKSPIGALGMSFITDLRMLRGSEGKSLLCWTEQQRSPPSKNNLEHLTSFSNFLELCLRIPLLDRALDIGLYMRYVPEHLFQPQFGHVGHFSSGRLAPQILHITVKKSLAFVFVLPMCRSITLAIASGMD